MLPQIKDAAKPIREAWDEIRTEFTKHSPHQHLNLTCVHRTPTEQFELYKKGRSLDSSGRWVVTAKDEVVTNVDGYKVVGAHNYYPSRAIDVVVVDNETGAADWKEGSYQPVLEIASRLGLESGGSWSSIRDWPHVQIKDYRNYKET